VCVLSAPGRLPREAMRRLVCLVLLLANAVYFAWSQGLLSAYGWGPASQSEPQRLAQQIRPQALQVLSPAELQHIEDQLQPKMPLPACWVAGPFEEAQGAVLRKALEAALPPYSWRLEPVDYPARWRLYQGKAELSGEFGSQREAQAALVRLLAQGVRTARVGQERAAGRGLELTVPVVSDEVKAGLERLAPLLAGKEMRACG